MMRTSLASKMAASSQVAAQVVGIDALGAELESDPEVAGGCGNAASSAIDSSSSGRVVADLEQPCTRWRGCPRAMSRSVSGSLDPVGVRQKKA